MRKEDLRKFGAHYKEEPIKSKFEKLFDKDNIVDRIQKDLINNMLPKGEV